MADLQNPFLVNPFLALPTIWVALRHVPEKSGLPSGVRGAETFRSTLPSGVAGVGRAGYGAHCARADEFNRAETPSVAATSMRCATFMG